MWVAFALQKLLTFFQQKISAYLRSLHVNFNESLTNDIVSFEQLGPDQGLKSQSRIYSSCVKMLHWIYVIFTQPEMTDWAEKKKKKKL